jgi:O-antigen ligase
MFMAAVGWIRGPRLPVPPSFLVTATLFSAWAMVSTAASWDDTAVIESTKVAAWLVFIVPGLVALLRDRRYMNSLLLGWAAGVAVFVVVGAMRLVQGRPVLDQTATGDGTVGVLYGVNRNGVNMRTVFILPFLLGGVGAMLMRWVRWPLLALAGVWLVNSGGRSGLLGLAVAGISYSALQPGVARRVRVILLALIIGIAAFTWIQSSEGQATTSTDRLTSLFRGERTDADDARELLMRKAWHLASENPAFGVGFGRFEGTYHPVIEEARNIRVRSLALEYSEHNTYAKILAETGFAGMLIFLSMIGSLMVNGAKRVHDRNTRLATAGLAGVMFVVFFHSAFSTLIYFPMTILLACISAADVPPEGEPARAPDPEPAGANG